MSTTKNTESVFSFLLGKYGKLHFIISIIFLTGQTSDPFLGHNWTVKNHWQLHYYGKI